MQTPAVRNPSQSSLKWLIGCFAIGVLFCLVTAGGWWLYRALQPCQSLDLLFSRSGCLELTPLSDTSLLRLSRDDRVLVEFATSLDNHVEILDLYTGKLKSISYDGSIINGVEQDIALTSDGHYAGVINPVKATSHLSLLDTTEAAPVPQNLLLPENQDATRLAFSPDDQVLAVAVSVPAGPDYVALFHVPDGALIGQLDLSGENFAVAYAPDGHLATAFDGQIEIWDVDKKSIETRFGSQIPPVYSMIFSPDGSLLAVSSGNSRYGSEGMVVGVYRVNDGQLLSQYHSKGSLFGDLPASFSPDGTLLAVSSCDEADVYRLSDGKFVTTYLQQWNNNPFQFGRCVSAIHFLKDGKSVYYGWESGGVVRWKFP